MRDDASIDAVLAADSGMGSASDAVSEFASYHATRARVETYFDHTATRTWERLTSDAPVSRIRQTVREGRDQMRDLLLSRLPKDLMGARVLDAGCGPGMLSTILAERDADVVGVDISPQLIEIAQRRRDPAFGRRLQFHVGDMLAEDLGSFDFVVAMDSLIYYTPTDIRAAVDRLSERCPHVVYTVAPKTPLLMAMWYAGKAFPQSDRSPIMVPHGPAKLARDTGGTRLGRVSKGFYISEALEVRR